MNDTQLLDRFVVDRDQAAFRSLVLRHGPAVLRACRSLLADHHEAEDAFQATFLVFVRRAPSIRDPERLGGWLIGVANRVAARARREAARRRARERRGVAMLAADAPTGRAEPDLRHVLREELDRLPDDYRAPLELCYLQGLTHEQAARRLGWPVGTVKVRLVRSRRLLRERLDRRGLALGMLLLLALPRGARAALPPSLVESTVEAMSRAASSERVAGTGPSRAAGSAPDSPGSGAAVRRRWMLSILIALAILTSTAFRIAARARADEGDEFALLPSSLKDVLNVRCR